MSRQKKSRSLKRIHSVKTGRRSFQANHSSLAKGSPRTKASGNDSGKCSPTSKNSHCKATNNHQSKSRYSASNPRKKQKSVYQQHLDSL